MREGWVRREGHTVGDEASYWVSLEVKLNVHVLALSTREGERDGALQTLPLSLSLSENHSRSEKSCRCGWSWHSQTLQRERNASHRLPN